MQTLRWEPFQKERSSKRRVVTAFAVLLVLGAFVGGLCGISLQNPLSAHAQSATGTWSLASSLPATRTAPTATLLFSGQVLVTGGFDNSGTASQVAYLYDPGTGMWTQTGSMQATRIAHTATLLPNGQVLVAGGAADQSGHPQTSAELYDPSAARWTQTGSMQTPRYGHTATLLPNGQVLVVGGTSVTGITASAELYNPATGIWTPTGSMQTPRYQHRATLLPNGQVLVAGGTFDQTGFPQASAELYDPGTGTWTPTGSMQTPRTRYPAILLNTGKVLVAGGQSTNGNTTSAELYDPATGTWTPTGSLNALRSADATATLLLDGQALIAASSSNPPELYDPATGTWTQTGPMQEVHLFAAATLLHSGQVLVVGGTSSLTASAELFTPSDLQPTPTPTPVCTPMPIQGSYQGTTTQDTTGQHRTFTLQVTQPAQPGSRFTGTLTLSGISSPIHISGSLTSQCKVTMSAINLQPAILMSFTGVQDSTGRVSGRYSLSFTGSTTSGGFTMSPV